MSPITFNEKSHTYTVDGMNLQSVTTIGKQYQHALSVPFLVERMGWNEQKAKDKLAEWSANGQRAKENGKAVDKVICDLIDAITKDGLSQTDASILKGYNVFNDILSFVDSELNLTDFHIYTQEILYDKDCRCAGTCDIRIVDEINKRMYFFDIKTGHKPSFHAWKNCNLLSPFDHLVDCYMNTYAMQLSFYALLAQMMYPDYIVDLENLWVVHVSSVQMKTNFIKVPYLPECELILHERSLF